MLLSGGTRHQPVELVCLHSTTLQTPIHSLKQTRVRLQPSGSTCQTSFRRSANSTPKTCWWSANRTDIPSFCPFRGHTLSSLLFLLEVSLDFGRYGYKYFHSKSTAFSNLHESTGVFMLNAIFKHLLSLF